MMVTSAAVIAAPAEETLTLASRGELEAFLASVERRAFKQAVFAAYGYFPGHEEYITNPPEPGPETRHFLIMDKTFNPVTYELLLADSTPTELSL